MFPINSFKPVERQVNFISGYIRGSWLLKYNVCFLKKHIWLLTIVMLFTQFFGIPVSKAEGEPVFDPDNPISPSTGSSAGGYEVTIKGENFTPGNTKVLFGSAEAEIVANDGTTLTVVVPARKNFEGGSSQAVDVTITNEIGSKVLDDGFTYTQSAPTIDTVTPDKGTSGTEITIVGSDFIDGAIVVIGGIDSQRVTFVDSTIIKAIVPANTSGDKKVTVTNPDGGTVSIDGAFYYEKSTPVINKIEPSKGPIGEQTSITITGDNFVEGATTITIGDKPATDVMVVNQTTITAKTPIYDTLGKRHVIVTVDGVNAIKENGFEYISNPKITSFTPTSGSVLGGTQLSISGSGFLSGASVKLGNLNAKDVQVKNDGLITCLTPATSTEGPVSITVSNPDGGTFTTTETEGGLFEYTISHPTINALSDSPPGVTPSEGSVLGGDLITINGSGFENGVKVYIDNKLASDINRFDDTKIYVKTPPNDSIGAKDVKVVNPDGGSYTLHDGFTYTRSQPVITGISPTQASTTLQPIITITGSDFRPGATVKIGTKYTTDVFVSSDQTTISARVPEGDVGVWDVTVTNPDKGEAVYKSFEYVPSSPSITDGPVNVSVESLIGGKVNTGTTVGGTEIRITGKEFSYSAQVLIGDRPATDIEVQKDYVTGITTITAKTPPGEVGSRTLIIKNPDGETAAGTFKYIVTPTITSITPNEGTTEGGTLVTLTGSGFNTGAEGVKVFVGGAEAADVTVKSSTELTFKTPINSDGIKDVVLINMDDDKGSYTFKDGFSYKLPPSNPIIQELSPTSGTTEGGTEITLKGKDFRSGAQVKIGDSFATDVRVATVDEGGETYTVITALTPSNTAGEHEVMVINSDGKAAVSPTPFTYKIPEKALAVTSITPNSGLTQGGTDVIIRGANFVKPEDLGGGIQRRTKVTIGGNEATDVVVYDDLERISAKTPGGTEGFQDVIVKIVKVDTATGDELEIEASEKLEGGFEYKIPQSQPDITGIDPGTGPSAGGTEVLITGQDFISDAVVYFGDKPAAYTQVMDSEHILAITPSSIKVGAVDVKVKNPDGGEAILYDGFVYKGNILVVTSITPNSGNVLGQTYVTLTGANFIEGTKVTIGGEAAAVIDIDATTIHAYTPANTPGTKDVVVSNEYGSATLPNSFIYYVPQSNPDIKDMDGDGMVVSPQEGTAAGGDVIYIEGEDFRSGAVVTIGGIEAPEVTVENPNRIKAVTPAGLPGWRDIVVTNTDGGTAVLEDGFLYISNPIINKIYPARGTTAGETLVTIEGENFDYATKVYIDGIETPYTHVINESLIKIKTPPHSAGTVDLKIENPDGGIKILEYGFYYRVPNTAPIIFSVTPNIGNIDGSTFITVHGDDFKDDAVLIIGENYASDVGVKDRFTITAKTPPGEMGKADVMVINSDDTGQFILKDGFEYKIPTSAPTLSKIEPDKGTIFGDTDVILTGTDFREGAEVIIGGNPAVDVEVVSPIKIRAKTPPGKHGKAMVTVVNPDGGSASIPEGFEYMAPTTLPEITDVTPIQGTVYGGTIINITGSDFREEAKVYVGGEPSPKVTVIDSNTIQATTPPNDAGEAEVSVVNPDTGLARWDGRFTYIVPTSWPKISSIGPNKGTTMGGTRITITGEDFRKGAKVLIGGREAVVERIEDSQGEEVDGVTSTIGVKITAVTPPGSPGQADVVVENPDTGLYTKENGFEYIIVEESSINISNINPNVGRTQGGTPFEIKGSGFAGGAKVFIGGIEATGVVAVDENTIRGRTPPNTPGVKDVTVQNSDGSTATLVGGFEYMVPGIEPKITAIDPNSGPTYGGTEVVIYGEHFQENAMVYIGDSRADVLSVDSTQIRAVTPPGTEGPKDVIVINPDTGLDLLEEGFTYKIYPSITGIEPNTGSTEGGTQITITGTAFADGAVVILGDKAAAEVTVISDTVIKAVTPANEAGYKDVIVINKDGGEGVLKNGFYYNPPRTAPDTPEGFYTREYDDRTIKLHWEAATHANYYEVYARRSGDDDYHYMGKTDRTTFYVTDLQPDTKYYFRIRAVNELGKSDFTHGDYARTDERDFEEDVKEEEIITEGNGLFININSEEALENGRLEIDEKYNRINRTVINMTNDVIEDLNTELRISSKEYELSLSAYMMRKKISNLNLKEKKEAGIRVIIQKTEKREKEKMIAALPRGYKPLSDIYTLKLERHVGKEVTDINDLNYYNQFTINFDYQKYTGLNKKHLGLYRYDPENRKWDKVTEYSGWYYGSFTGQIIKPGSYMLAAH